MNYPLNEIINKSDYLFNLFLIKPNNPFNKNNSYFFEENFYKILNIKYDKPINNINYSILIDYLNNKKDFIEIIQTSYNNLLELFYSKMNPANDNNRCFDVKTCLNNDTELIMYMYDDNIKNINQYNHIASLFNPTFESIFGPVFLIKILKDKNNNIIKNVDITLDDFINLWVSLKQVKYWNFINMEDITNISIGDTYDESEKGNHTHHRETEMLASSYWSIDNIFNNNQHFNHCCCVKDITNLCNNSKGRCDNYQFINIDKYMIFFKYINNNIVIEDINNFFKNNINNNNILNKYFKNIKICRLKFGEYANKTYNVNLLTLNEQIIYNVIIGFNDYKNIFMENIFINIENNLPIFNS
jgi:hypothetical protein